MSAINFSSHKPSFLIVLHDDDDDYDMKYKVVLQIEKMGNYIFQLVILDNEKEEFSLI